jgi:hypothetical protein
VCAPCIAELLLCLCQLLLRECQLAIDLHLSAPQAGQLQGQGSNLGGGAQGWGWVGWWQSKAQGVCSRGTTNRKTTT